MVSCSFKLSDSARMTILLMDFAGVLLNMLVNPPLPVYSLLVCVPFQSISRRGREHKYLGIAMSIKGSSLELRNTRAA